MTRLLIGVLTVFFFSNSSQGVTLPKIFGDTMVLQQNDSVHFWGWASGWRTKLLVTTSWGVSDTIQSNAEGNWNTKIKLDVGQIVNPQKVRFAWRNTASPFLMNGAGLPASCFGEQVITKEM